MTDRVEKVQTLGQYAAVLKRRWACLVTIIPAAVLIAVFWAYTAPTIYSSSATILLESSSIDPGLIKTTVVSYADQKIELVRQAVMTPERLEPIVKELDPYPERTTASIRDKANTIIGDTAVARVDPITLEPVPVSSAFSITYKNKSPNIAVEITQKVADLFLAANRETRTAQATDAYNFMLAKSQELEKQIRSLEERISEFKAKYGDALPDTVERNESGLERTQRELDSTKSEIRVVEQQESLLKLQISQISPTLVASGTDIFTQLGTLRAQLAEAQQKYTPDHPDVKRLTRAINTLSEQAKLGNPQNIKPDNPEYMRVSAELDSVRTNLAAMRANAARAEAQIKEYEKRLSQSPTVERDYVELTRTREIAQQQYAAVQNKLSEAQISKTLESEAKGERYTLIRKAYFPDTPTSPNRRGIILLGIVLGGGLAIGLAALRESSDPSVRSTYDVSELVDLPLIGAIPNLLNPENRRRRQMVWGSVGAVYIIATLIVGIVVLRAA